jgi:hypothetical protein
MSKVTSRLESRTTRRTGKVAAVSLALAAATVLSACQTGPAYRERGPGDNVGYTDLQLTPNRYRVTFAGGTGTSREEVEDYLLRRAAEVTLQSGFSHFVFDTRDTNAETYYRGDSGPRTRLGIGFGSFGPSPWYYSSFAFDPFYDRDVRPITRFDAYSEIVMLTPPQAADEPASIDARRVLAALTPPAPPPPPSY